MATADHHSAYRATQFHAGQVWDSTRGLVTAFSVAFGEQHAEPPAWDALTDEQRRRFTTSLPHVFGPVCHLQSVVMRRQR